MMQYEFENLIGHAITREEYKKIETVYLAFDYEHMSEDKIADLYKYDSKLVTDTLYGYIHDTKEYISELNAQLDQFEALLSEARSLLLPPEHDDEALPFG